MSWYGVDLDGTLAKYDGWIGMHHIGDPVEPMVARVREWLAEGKTIKIFTARYAHVQERAQVVEYIHAWLKKNGLPALEVTNVKDFGMITLYDDRCVQVEMNTGRLIGG